MRKIMFGLWAFTVAILPASAILAADKHWGIDEVMGRADAPITVIEYASLTCSHCAHFDTDIFPRVKKEWIDTGKVKWIMRDYVWDPMAEAAAMISHCSGERYFTFVDTYFHSQANWLHAPQPLDSLKGIARLGGMSGEQVDACLANRGLLSEILARKDDAEKLYGVSKTPSFVINGKLAAEGAGADYESFAKLLK